MIEGLIHLSSAFGLSTSAGLNAYIPLLMVAVLGRFTTLIQLQEPFDALTSWWSIGALVILLAIEVTVDKIPAVDTINDGIQTFVRPAAGALLFASQANVISDVSPILAVIAGLILAGGVHTAKGITRPMVTASTAGTGNWVVSIMEDVTAFFVSLMAIILPIIIAAMLLVTGALGLNWYVKRRKMA
ncbi:MAG: DUF4126 domain-containing protein [Chloroflexi bacterium]|nr:DUF4126 domain-containing protein [Chloroflexota bacterium]MDA0244272.1 DUF4126 domain-containing protein [Chloroflexota bacterium]